MKLDMRCYAMYKGDEFIVLGTLEELSVKYNIPRRQLQWHKSPTAMKKYEARRKFEDSKQIIIIVVEEDEE